MVLQTFGDHLRDPVASADPQKAAQRRKQMMFELNRSGQYLQLQEQLRACVVRIVQEHFHKAGTMDRQDMQVRAVPFMLSQEAVVSLFGFPLLMQGSRDGQGEHAVGTKI